MSADTSARNGRPAVFAGKRGRFRTIRHGARFTAAHALFCAAVAGAEAGAAWLYFTGHVGMAGLGLLHAGAVAGVIAALVTAARGDRDLSLLSVLFAATLFTGPFGAVGCALMAFYLLSLRPSPERLNAWYDKIGGSIRRDPAGSLFEAIDSGRHSVEDLPSNRAFLDVLQNGTLRQRQIVLGLVSRNFNEDFLPVLTAALKSPDALMRVQAAAIANRLSRKYRDKIWVPVG